MCCLGPIKMIVDSILGYFDADLQKIIVAIVLSTAGGSLLAYVFQSMQWKRQKRFELLQHQLREGKDLAHEVTQLVNRRFFALQRLLWAIQEKSGNVDSMWANYYGDVIQWNQNLTSIRIRTRLFAGSEVAMLLVNDADLEPATKPKSIHYGMRRLHTRILEAKRQDALSEAAAAEITSEIEHLNNLIQIFRTGFSIGCCSMPIGNSSQRCPLSA